MSGSWNAHDRLKARMAACLGTYSPQKYTIRIDDDHDRWRYRIAAAAIYSQQLPGFFVWCVEYVIRHHRDLKGVRRSIREAEKEIRKRKRREHLAERRARREAAKRCRR